MACQNALTVQILSIPHFNSIVSQTRDNFLVIILKAIDTFGIFTAAINALKVVLAAPPIILYGLNVLDYGGVELAVKAVIGVVFARFRLE